MCEEWQSVPGITDQVEYLRLHSQVNIIIELHPPCLHQLGSV